jgi:uncharacterized protein (TIGR02453 family)
MPRSTAILTPETFKFFRDLARNNRKDWMDANRDRYQQHVVQPLRALLDALAPAALKLHAGFDTSGRTGANFSRINRDIRFAKDKTPYRPQMYLMFPDRADKDGGQLYVGVMPDEVTAGFRIYGMGKESTLCSIARPRAAASEAWLRRQRQRLARKYESYWYSTEKGEWTKHGGWPSEPEEWKRLKGWIVRRKMKPAAATRAVFVADVSRVFRDLMPLFEFTSKLD